MKIYLLYCLVLKERQKENANKDSFVQRQMKRYQ